MHSGILFPIFLFEGELNIKSLFDFKELLIQQLKCGYLSIDDIIDNAIEINSESAYSVFSINGKQKEGRTLREFLIQKGFSMPNANNCTIDEYMLVMEENEYYMYFDEGGMFGRTNLLLSRTRLEPNYEVENHITEFYFGRLPLVSIKRLLRLFTEVHSCKINYNELSNIKDLDLSPPCA